MNDYDGVRWTHSPLRRAIDDVVRASAHHVLTGARTAANKATNRVVYAADELRAVVEDIRNGNRDSYGYLRSPAAG